MTKKITPPPSAAANALADKPSAIITTHDDELPQSLAFTPVPRRTKRWNGLTELKQRTFIINLAGCGSVEMAAASVGASAAAFYSLRKADGAESFAAAWEVAVDMGARIVLDRLMEHAIHGTPERLIKDGEVILERRKYNTRAMMWIVQQRFPETYGGGLNVTGAAASALPHSIRKLKDRWRAEWEEEQKTGNRVAEEETNAALVKKLRTLQKRNWFKRFVPWMDDAEKRAACEVLYGAQDWAAIRAAAEREARGGRLDPAVEARLGYKGG